MTTWAWRSDCGDGTYLADGCGFKTEKKATAAAIASGEDDEYWVCPCESPELSDYLLLGAAMERAKEEAEDEGHLPEGCDWPDPSDEATQEFYELLDAWASKNNLHPNFYLCGTEHRVELAAKKGK